MKKNILISSIAVGLGFPLTQLTVVLYTPALSIMRQFFGVSAQQMLFTVSIILMGYTIGNLFWGTLSDRIGRRYALLSSLVGYLVLSFVIPMTHVFSLFAICLVFYGFFAGAFTSIGNALLKDINGQEKVARVIAFVGIAMATTPVVAPIIGTHLLHHFGWQAIYHFIAIYATVMLLGILLFVPHVPKPKANSLSLRKSLTVHLSNKKFMNYLIVLAFLFGGILSTLEMLPMIYTHYLSMPALAFGYWSLVFMISYPMGSFISSRLVSAWGIRCMMTLGLSIAMVSAALLCLLSFLEVKDIILMSVVMACLFLGFGLSLSMAKAGAMTSVKHQLGSASSLMKFIQSFGGMLITVINAHLYQNNAISHYAILLLIVLSSGFFVLRYGLITRPMPHASAS